MLFCGRSMSQTALMDTQLSTGMMTFYHVLYSLLQGHHHYKSHVRHARKSSNFVEQLYCLTKFPV